MSKTYIISITGEKFTRINERRKIKKTKFMGFTDGQHSHGVYDHVIEDGQGFEISCERLGAQKQICGGGEYPGGIGFAIGIDRLLLLNTQEGQS